MSETKLLITAITVLASVVAYLFKLYLDRSKQGHAAEIAMNKERESWLLERTVIGMDHKRAIEKLEEEHNRELDKIAHEAELHEQERRADFERRKYEMLEHHDAARRRESEIFQAHEDQVRKEFAVIMERIADEGSKSSAAVVQLMQKMFERFTGPRGH